MQAVRSGLPIGTSYDGPVRLPIVLRLGDRLPEATGLPALPLPLPEGGVTRLGQVADVSFFGRPTSSSATTASGG